MLRIRDKSAPTYILFNGLDTFATVSFCGQHIATTDNQFRQWRLNITDALARCADEHPLLQVDFESATEAATRLAEAPGAEKWPFGVEGWFEYPHRAFIRKEQSDFGWDWGPAFAPAGIWQKAWVVQISDDKLMIPNSALDIYREGQLNNLPPDQSANWVLNASVDSLTTIPAEAKLKYNIQMGGKTVDSGYLGKVNNSQTVITGATNLDASKFDLWWPAGMGNQTLYNVTVEIEVKNKTVASVVKRTGFRTIVLNMEPINNKQLAQGIAPGNNCKHIFSAES